MNDLVLPPLNPLLNTKIEPRLMKDTYKKVHIYLFDFDLMLGKGSFSKVYKGINLNTNQQVAVKVVEMTSITTPKLKQLLLQQIDILMKIKNENLIRCFEVLSSAKNTYIVMELCTYDFGVICDYAQKQYQIEKTIFLQKPTQFNNTPATHSLQNQSLLQGQFENQEPKNQYQKEAQASEDESLSNSINSISSTKSVQIEQISEQSNFPNGVDFGLFENEKEEKLYPYIKQIFEGLEYLQGQNIVHRDLKLSNIFLTASKACKIGDFGFATIIPANQIQIKDTCCIGSPLYMSPQSYIENVYSLKSDVWSFGIMIFEMIYGNPPHWNCPTHEVLKSEIRKQIDLKKFERLWKISEDLKQVLEGCLQVDVRKRFTIKEIKQTRLFKRLFYQPLESNVIVSSRQRDCIDESRVEVFGRSNMRNDSIKAEYKTFEYNNYSAIEKVKQESFDALNNKINRLINGEQQDISKSTLKNQNLLPKPKSNPFQEKSENNSFSDRAHEVETKPLKRPTTSNKLDNCPQKLEDINDLKFNSTDLNAHPSKEVCQIDDQKKGSSQSNSKTSPQIKQFLYKNSEEMQKFLKQMKQTRKTPSSKNTPDLIMNQSPITFTDLTNILTQEKHQSKEQDQNETQSPKFASTFTGPFFNSSKYQKNDKSHQSRKLTELGNYSVHKNANTKLIKPSTSYSVRNNSADFGDNSGSTFKHPNKQNQKQETLAPKNYSNGPFPSSNKHYSVTKESEKYDKKKMLDKCISTPKFQSFQLEDIKKNDLNQDKTMKHMTTSTFFTSSNHPRSPRVYHPSASNINKEFNTKDQFSSKNTPSGRNDVMAGKNFEGSNLWSQFSTKNKETTQIQKKTYWKGANTKNFLTGHADRQVDFSKNQSIKHQNYDNLNPIRNHSYLIEGNSQQMAEPESVCKKQRIGGKQVKEGDGQGFGVQSFKLLNGQLIIQDACEMVHLSRLLHKLSFMTENNGNSILLLQYSIQILRNLQQKCENFEIKYHYNSSTNNPIEVREAFKANELCLNSLATINEKECYAIKRESPLLFKENSTICNKTIQLQGIIDSYIKKYLQRKEALIKLFECNVLFENLANKVKEAKHSIQHVKGDKLTPKKRSSLSCERGFLNFTRLEKVIEEIETEFQLKKQSERAKMVGAFKGQLQQGVGNKILLKTVLAYIQGVQKCLNEHSFMRLIEFARSILSSGNEKVDWDFLKENKTEENGKSKSVIERLLEGCSQDIKNHPKSSNYHQSDLGKFGKNYSVLVSAYLK